MKGQRSKRAKAKRGRPPKYGRPGQVVAITLPDEAVRALKRINNDLGWAIVGLLQNGLAPKSARLRQARDSELVSIANGLSLIVVNRKVFKHLSAVHMIPLDGDRAFLALDREAGVADLELAVLDRMENRGIGAHERTALADLRVQLRRWRRHPGLRCQTRSVIVIEKRNERTKA